MILSTPSPQERASLPSVSVIIPVYNRAFSIRDALVSVQSQSFGDLECIIVDDGSEDHVQLTETVQSLDDARFRIVHQPNLGGSSARNRGISEAAGKYLAFLDSDDTFFPDHLYQALSALREEDENLVVYGAILVDRGDERTFLKPHRGILPNENVSEYLLCEGGFMQTSTLVLRADMARRVGFAPGLRFGQDTDFAIRLAAAGARFRMIEGVQARWMDQSAPGRVSSSLDPAVRINWLTSVDSLITRKARRSDEGWHLAKCISKQGRPFAALALYARAVLTGCYRPALAVRIGLQIFVPTSMYRRASDVIVAIRGHKKGENKA
ncbi:glycosyltransferase family 2 protein [Stenotrophomonas chelatiphaga]|uniref:glycosyltransferase family 2 protein n=1 Tax=Stenotrophomonas chelatiphaga TaxID=517011 RepID=UPI002897AA3C|nr:glycosyltransferase [Stenotrophomonas chelatiphaga]